MELCVVGINNKSCPLHLRELLTRAFEEVFGNKGKHLYSFSYVLLSTCNRVEIYFTDHEIASVHVKILAILRKKMTIPFEHVLYFYFESDVFLHLVRVTCGLDSAIIGECDIQRQVKLAYEQAGKQRQLSSYLHYLFQKSLRVGKQIRSLYTYSKGGVNFEELVFAQIKMFLQELSSHKLLFIGNSEMNRKFLPLFSSKPFKKLSMYSRRGLDRELLVKYPSLNMGGKEIFDSWQEYDVVISATKDSDYVLKNIERKTRHNMLLVDLSIPRSIDPELAKNPKTMLLNIEDIAFLFEEKRCIYKTELMSCEKAVHDCVSRYFVLYRQKLLKKQLYVTAPSLVEVS